MCGDVPDAYDDWKTHPNVGIVAERQTRLDMLFNPASCPDSVSSVADTHLHIHGHDRRQMFRDYVLAFSKYGAEVLCDSST